jgi:acetyl-CoA C-acetyltransferase
MKHDPVVITACARTPLGAFLGALSPFTAPQLGAQALAAVLSRSGLPPEAVDAIVMGCVLPAGQGQAPARQASLGAGLPLAAGAITVNKMCGSGLTAVMLAHDMILAGSQDVVMAGGMESMSNAPHLLPRLRTGLRMKDGLALDHMLLDGLQDAYEPGRHMGSFAEDCARQFGFTREQQDDFARTSLTRALAATARGDFAWELAHLNLPGREPAMREDEPPTLAQLDKIPRLKPAFCEGGTITAANASSIADGAAALMLMRQSHAEKIGLAPLARILAHSTHAQESALFTTAPVGAIEKVLERAGWRADEVDLFEINEAFAVVTLAAMRSLDLPHDKVNIHGGACALGHPIGASGARILVTLLGALRARGARRGVASLCIGGGEAVALALERLEG